MHFIAIILIDTPNKNGSYSFLSLSDEETEAHGEKAVYSKSLQTGISFPDPLLVPPEDAFCRALAEWHQRTAGEHWSQSRATLSCTLVWYPQIFLCPHSLARQALASSLSYTMEIAYSFKATEGQLCCCSHTSWVLTPNQTSKVLRDPLVPVTPVLQFGTLRLASPS